MILDELEREQPPGLGLSGPAVKAIDPADARRDRFIARGVTIARELGAEVDARPDPEAPGAPRRQRPAPVRFE